MSYELQAPQTELIIAHSIPDASRKEDDWSFKNGMYIRF